MLVDTSLGPFSPIARGAGPGARTLCLTYQAPRKGRKGQPAPMGTSLIVHKLPSMLGCASVSCSLWLL